jgi:hypothetical protein
VLLTSDKGETPERRNMTTDKKDAHDEVKDWFKCGKNVCLSRKKARLE